MLCSTTETKGGRHKNSWSSTEHVLISECILQGNMVTNIYTKNIRNVLSTTIPSLTPIPVSKKETLYYLNLLKNP